MANPALPHHDLKDFVQFGYDPQQSKEPGNGGWGFDVKCGGNDYRIVIYAPERFDDTDTKNDAGNDSEKITSYRDRLGIKHVRVTTRGDRYEHGPAHVHVIDKKSYRESKFELIEHFNNDSFKSRVARLCDYMALNDILAANIKSLLGKSFKLPATPESLGAAIIARYPEAPKDKLQTFLGALEERMGNSYPPHIDKDINYDSHFALRLPTRNITLKPLLPQQMEDVLPIIQNHVPEFLQLWREFYKHTTLASEVSRISEIFPNYIARIQCESEATGENSWTVKLRHRDNHSKQIAIPLEEYAHLLPRPKKRDRN